MSAACQSAVLFKCFLRAMRPLRSLRASPELVEGRVEKLFLFTLLDSSADADSPEENINATSKTSPASFISSRSPTLHVPSASGGPKNLVWSTLLIFVSIQGVGR